MTGAPMTPESLDRMPGRVTGRPPNQPDDFYCRECGSMWGGTDANGEQNDCSCWHQCAECPEKHRTT